jgi:hypothetical protein
MANSRHLDPHALAKEIVDLQEKRAEVRAVASSGRGEQAYGAKLSKSAAVFIDAADQAITSATNVYEGRIGGGSVTSAPPDVALIADWLGALDSIEERSASPTSSADITPQTSIFSRSEQGQATLTEQSERRGTPSLDNELMLADDIHQI